MNLYESINGNMKESPVMFEKGPQVYSGKVQDVLEKVQNESVRKVLEALRPEVEVKVTYNEEQNKLKVETEYFVAWDGEIPTVAEEVKEDEQPKEDFLAEFRQLNMEDFYSKLFEKFVPMKGAAETVGGEIVRAINRIDYRLYNDGDHIGVEYGNETCNAAARYLKAKCGNPVDDVIEAMWGEWDDGDYKECLNQLKLELRHFLLNNQELFTTNNTEDMFDYSEKEDNDWYSEDDDEEWY